MPKDYEFKSNHVYQILILIILVVVMMYLMCDFKILGNDYCVPINSFMDGLTNKVNDILGI